MGNHSVIEHRANYHYIKLEEDYIQICSQGKEYPHCKAFILAILEHWMNDKRSKGQSEFIYMSYPQWIDAMYGLFRRNHIINCLNELVQEQLIFKRPYRIAGKDTFEYCLNVQEVQNHLKALEEKTEKYTRPKVNAFKFKRVEKQTGVNLNDGTPPNLNGTEQDDPFKFGHNIDSITELPDNITSEESNSEHTETDTLASPHVDALSLSNNDTHSQENVPIADSNTTPSEGDTHGTDNTHSSASHPHSREPGVDRTANLDGIQADSPLGRAEQHPSRDSRTSCREIVPQGGDHAPVPAPGHPHRLGDVPGAGVGRNVPPLDDRQVAALEARPVLEAGQKEIEGEPDHAQPLQPVPVANHPDSGSSNVPGDSALDSTGSPGTLDAPSVDRAEGSAADGREGRGGLAEDTASGIGSGASGEAHATRDTALGQLDGNQQTPLFSSTVEPGESGMDTLPVAPVTGQAAPAQGQEGKRTGKRPRPSEKLKEVKPELTPEGEALYQDWCSLFHVTIPKYKSIIEAANDLAEPITFWAEQKLGISKAEVLKRIMNWLYKNNPDYYGEGRGVKLYDIRREFEGWQSAAERKLTASLRLVPSHEPEPVVDKSKLFNMEHIVLPRKGMAR